MTAAITVKGLGKYYRVDHLNQGAGYRTLRESLSQGVGSAWNRLRGGQTSRSTETFWALRDVDFEIEPGEVVGIIGRNGAGKSTLLKILSRITKPSTGKAKLHGRVSSLLEVGTGFHPELTGRENIFLNGAILGMSRNEIASKFDAIVDFSGVEKFLDTPVKRYSSGMYVRLAFSVAAHLESEVMIVDEVLAVGDAEFQRKCLGQMQSIALSGRTVLFVSHNMSAIEGLCGHGIFLEGGRVLYHGDQRTAIDRYMEASKSFMPVGQLDLETGPSEASRHGPRIVRATVTSEGKCSHAGYPVGAPLEFRVVCMSTGDCARPALGIGIDNNLGQRITTLHTDFSCQIPWDMTIRGHFEFTCQVENLALQPGEYRLKFSLEANGDALHVIEQAMLIRILPTDYYANGGKLGRGVVLCRQEWSLRGGAEA